MPHLDFADGFRLYYQRRGRGPVVLFAHGAGGNAESWWQQVPDFSRRYTTVTFDHRAFGRSPDTEDGPGRIAFGTDTLALLDALEIERVHMIAHSMGGRTAFGLFSRAPERIASITYSGTNGGVVSEETRRRKAELEREGYYGGSLLKRALDAEFYERAPEMAFLYRQIRSINPPRPRDFLAPAPRRLNYRGTTAGRLAESGIPILWVVGERDRVVAPELIEMAHHLTPGSRFRTIAGAGHSSYFERPDAWNAVVLDFIDAVEARKA